MSMWKKEDNAYKYIKQSAKGGQIRWRVVEKESTENRKMGHL